MKLGKKNLKIITAVIVIIILFCAAIYYTNFTQEKTEIIKNSELQIAKGETFSVKLVDSNNVGIANKTINIQILSSNYEQKKFNITTDNEGIASLTLDDFEESNYTITSTFSGDSKYESSSLKQNVTIESNDNNENNSSMEYNSNSNDQSTSDEIFYDAELNVYYNSEGIVVAPEGYADYDQIAGKPYSEILEMAEYERIHGRDWFLI